MKKILILISFIILLTGCVGPKTYQTINYKKLEKMLNDNESFVLVVGSATCQACNIYRRTMEEVIKEFSLMIYYVDVANFNNADIVKLDERFNIVYTPTTIIIIDGEEATGRIEGAANREEVVRLLQNYSFIKGDG